MRINLRAKADFAVPSPHRGEGQDEGKRKNAFDTPHPNPLPCGAREWFICTSWIPGLALLARNDGASRPLRLLTALWQLKMKRLWTHGEH